MTRRHSRLPLRVRLVAGFAVAMLVVLGAAGGFVFWRVRYALDLRLGEDLQQQGTDLRAALAAHPDDPRAALRAVPTNGRLDAVLGADGAVLAGQGAARALLVPGSRLEQATAGPVRYDQGNVWSPPGKHLRINAFPLGSPTARLGVTAVRMDQRDEALRELLLQLAVANVLALGVASLVGYRLARAALAPVEQYRTQAAAIAGGATGIRLDVPDGIDDEVTRLGHTLNAMLSAQEEAGLRQRQFIADASHELRTPLTLLTSEVELALRRPRTREELEATLQEVAGDTRRLVALADSLLTLEAADAGPGDPAAVDTRAALQAAAQFARSLLPAGDDREVTVRAPAGLTAVADGTALTRILANLTENAAHHGAGTITLTAAAADQGVRLVVHDHGTIPAAFLPRAADRFRRADAARRTPGTGLGLALVHALVRAHHGQLRICSAGAHHQHACPDPALAALPCVHPTDGTSVTVLLPDSGGSPRRGGSPQV